MIIVEPSNWHEWRSTGIGASDAASACGASKYKTRYQLWLEKTGQIDRKEATERMQWGLRLEKAIENAYVERTGNSVVRTQVCCEHKMYPWMRATIDGYGPDRVQEFKSVGLETGRILGEDGDSESLPTEWVLQAQHQLAVTSFDVCDVVVFLGHLLELRIYPVERNDFLIDSLIEHEEDFWDRVQSKTAPIPESIKDYVDFIKRVGLIGKRVHLEDPESCQLISCYQDTCNRIREFEKLRESYKQEILVRLDGHEYGDLPDGREIRSQVIDVPERVQTVKAHSQLRLTVRHP